MVEFMLCQTMQHMIALRFCISKDDATVGGGWGQTKDDMDLPVEMVWLAPDGPALFLNVQISVIATFHCWN